MKFSIQFLASIELGVLFEFYLFFFFELVQNLFWTLCIDTKGIRASNDIRSRFFSDEEWEYSKGSNTDIFGWGFSFDCICRLIDLDRADAIISLTNFCFNKNCRKISFFSSSGSNWNNFSKHRILRRKKNSLHRLIVKNSMHTERWPNVECSKWLD